MIIARFPNGSLVGEFLTTTDAAEALGVDRTSISKVLNGHRSSAGGYIFEHEDYTTVTDITSSEWQEFRRWKGIKDKAKTLPSPYKKGDKRNVLIIGDTHEPFSREGYMEHCRQVQEQFDCGTVIHIGDEVDNHAISFHESDPDGLSSGSEANEAMTKMKLWYQVFPEVTVIVGNHSALPFRQAMNSGMSRRFMKSYEQVWEAPSGWKWEMEVERDNVLYTHGTGSMGPRAAIDRAIHYRMNVVQGHIHTEASVQWSASSKDKVFGMQVGCGVNDSSYAMAYAKGNKRKSIIACGVVLDSGRLPIVIPMDL